VNIVFERAIPADAETLVKVQIAAFHHDSVLYPDVPQGGPPGYTSVETALQKMREDEFYKIIADGQIVGGFVIFDVGNGHYHLDVIFIDPAYQDRGIGTQAIQFMEQTYPASLWTLNTPAYAIRNQHFYEKHGYVKVGEGLLDEGGGQMLLLYDYEKRI
jgi:ribosomal protein S18 acetylase RimI-like enzyme